MNSNQIHNVYFIGIGGIGMSALARYFQNVGKKVSGYDKTPTTLTDELIADGMDIHFEDNLIVKLLLFFVFYFEMPLSSFQRIIKLDFAIFSST
jgi:UDP-N-acetylmuramate--alanine ligase